MSARSFAGALALSAALALPALLASPGTQAGADLVKSPAYTAGFVNYNAVDRPDRKLIRFMYVNPESDKAARAGQPLPHGTVLVMEDRKAKLGPDGSPELDAEGRMIATDEVANVFVMEKQKGWGAEYPADKRNGEWEYAWFLPDGKPRPNSTFDGCFACHKTRDARDFTFTYFKNVADRK